MAFKSGISTNPDPAQAARELAGQLATAAPKLVLYFASPAYAPEDLAAALRRELGAVPSIGCTTAGELAQGRMLKRSVVAAVFDEELLESAVVGLVRDTSSEHDVSATLGHLAASFGATAGELDPLAHVGLVLHDGLAAREEEVMATLGARTNVTFVGGSAGDDLAFEATSVSCDFEAARGACALALLEPRGEFRVLKTQSFDVLDATLTVTRADERTRTVHEFNGRPAAEEYARVLGIGAAELPGYFQSSPLGLVVGKEPYVRSPQQLQGSSVVFYCQMPLGTTFSLLRSRDIVEDTRRDFANAVRELGSLRAAVNFHCILRTLELEGREQTRAYGALFADAPAIGFSTYGESYIGHVNQTSTMLLLG